MLKGRKTLPGDAPELDDLWHDYEQGMRKQAYPNIPCGSVTLCAKTRGGYPSSFGIFKATENDVAQQFAQQVPKESIAVPKTYI